VADRFHVCRTLGGTLTSPLPVGNRVLRQSIFCVVMRQQFGLHLAEVGKAYLQYLGNVLVVLLARAAQ